ncbi:MAG: tRNA (adenosine(37)-N6)-dimethylallyltransferase MiaA [Ruminococcus sp.]|nr:tRNA (adenosine(37)-N6)-dimethylallyltransferase MiaA [Ruminococcus sp.]
MSAERKKIPLLVVCGPTASGKTGLAVDLAREYGGEVISADSMQIYKDMSIITARATEEEMRGVPHHLTGFLPLDKSFSTAEYVELARGCIEDIYSRGRLPIVCGGTGLYISSLLNNVRFDDTGADPKLRAELEGYAEQNGRHALWERLKELDPEAAEKIHENNLVRVVRAIEVCITTGIPFSEQRRRNLGDESLYDSCVIRIDFEDRAELYERINIRVDRMLDAGMVDEAREIYETKNPATAYQAIGYKELIAYLKGEAELDECVEKIKLETRHYAKRQLTWFRRMNDANTIYAQKTNEYKIFFENVQNTIAKSKILCYNRL